MLSVCIPIYNFDATILIEELYAQLKKIDDYSEIVVIDDCSLDEYKKLNKKACEKHQYIELPKNIGRSKIRNLFLKYAQYDFLLFLDCDSIITTAHFLSNYIKTLKTYKHEVIYGGRIYPSKKPERNRILRWKYGVSREVKTAEKRLLEPHKSFISNNFIVKKEVLNRVKFDERITKYGHEDTLFSFNLHQKGIQIFHIDNPILNGDIESNTDFINNTEKGVINLISITNFINNKEAFTSYVKILNFYKKVESKNLVGMLRFIFRILRPMIKRVLTHGSANLQLLDFYKLGIYITHKV